MNLDQDRSFLLGRMTELLALKFDLVVEELVLGTHGNVFAHGHAEAPRHETSDAGKDHGMGVTGRCTGDAQSWGLVGTASRDRNPD
jgi:hypothetical protein